MAYKNDRTKNRRRYKTRYRSAHSYKQKRSSSQTKSAVLVSVLTFVIIASLVIIFTFGDSIFNSLDGALKNAQSNNDATTPTTTATKAPTQPQTQPPTEAPTAPPVVQEDTFMQLLSLNNLTEEQLEGSQMIFVDADESTLTCKVYCYEKDDTGLWSQVIGPFNGYIGSAGIDEFVAPYESKTPTGVFKIEYAFGTRSNPGTGLDYTQFSYGDYWITDPNSTNYNRWMYSTDYIDWSSAQELWQYTISYPYAVVFEYNRSPVDKTQGSAKFLHVKYGVTEGGIGVSENDILSILYWLNHYKTPYIAISK